MYESYSTAAPKQLHTALAGPNGTHACLTLYNECPHTSQSAISLRPRDPYLHCDQPFTSTPRTIEYINKDGTRIVETTRSTLYFPAEARCTQFITSKLGTTTDPPHSTLALRHPKGKAAAASVARLVLPKHSPTMHHIRASTQPALRSILKPSRSAEQIPTVYLLTFSTDRTPTTKHFARLLNEHVPPGVPLRYTIDARGFRVPPRRVQEEYSGVSKVVQDNVLQDRGARSEVEHAVDELMGFVRSSAGETVVAVCCTAGTHRSVAVAECIAGGVRESVRRADERVRCRVVVRHVHRVKGRGDEY